MIDPEFGHLVDIFAGRNVPARLWQFEVQTQAFAEPLRVQFETTDDIGVPESVRKAYKEFVANQHSYKRLALETLIEYYQTQITPLAVEHGFSEITPSVDSVDELEALLSYPCLFIHPSKDGLNHLGLGFECVWDVEHGTGVLFGNGKVLEVGIDQVSFMG
jgi:hypothetical protein